MTVNKIRRISTVTLALSLVLSTSTLAAGFKDIKGHWAEPTIEWGQEKGYVSGYPDGSFKPNNQVTEAEILTMLLSTMEAPVDKEENTGHWADPYYDFARKVNYPTTGSVDQTQRNGKISRVKVAELVSSTQGVHYNGNDAIKYLLVNGLARGKTSSTVEGFGGGDLLTRAEAIAFIKNVKQQGIGELKERPTDPTDRTELNRQYENMVKNQQQPTTEPTPEPTAWTPSTEVRVVADQLFPSYKETADSVTVTMPVVKGYGFVATYETTKYKANDSRYISDDHLKQGQTYTFKKGDGGLIGISIQGGKYGNNVESYGILIDDRLVYDMNDKPIPLDSVLKE